MSNSARLLQASGPGTVSYAAPETLKTNEVSSASDMYSLGCVLWELLSLREPWLEFNGAAFRIMSAVINDRQSLSIAQIPEDVRDQLPRVIDALKLCLAYDPADRPKAVDMYDVLDDAIETLLS